MALFPCPECGEKISDQATACPHCGCPVQPRTGAYSLLQQITGQDGELAALLHLSPVQIEEINRNTLNNRPSVVASGLTEEEAQALAGQFTYPHHFKVIRSADIPAPPPPPDPAAFGSSVDEVILCVIVALLILAFF